MIGVRYNFMDDLHKLVIRVDREGYVLIFLPQCLSQASQVALVVKKACLPMPRMWVLSKLGRSPAGKHGNTSSILA